MCKHCDVSVLKLGLERRFRDTIDSIIVRKRRRDECNEKAKNAH
jgi:hypothetical protein